MQISKHQAVSLSQGSVCLRNGRLCGAYASKGARIFASKEAKVRAILLALDISKDEVSPRSTSNRMRSKL